MTNETTLAAQNSAKNYYGEVLSSSKDLLTDACCTGDAIPSRHKELLKNIDDEILTRFYGCGSPIPEAIEACTVLDLGCGTGRDVYLAAQLVGESGRVIGVDMTAAQLELARSKEEVQREKFGFAKSNVEFIEAYIENLSDIESESVDVVTSNCVINLCADKKAVFREIFRVLKPGGELYFSDVFADRRLDPVLMDDPILHGECLSGAMYQEDFRRLLAELGCPDFRVISSREFEVHNSEIREKLGLTKFFSDTIRAFKLESLEDRCEDFGQGIRYRGTIDGCAMAFHLDGEHEFLAGKVYEVCGNTAAMVSETRFAPHFDLFGDHSRHYGLFDCVPTVEASGGGSACC